jgi:hypothetical protein
VINTLVERTFPLAQAVRRFASPRGPKPLHPSAGHRWRYPGIDGITLECIKVGGVWHTSHEALQRFFERLTAAREGAEVPRSTGPPAWAGHTAGSNEADRQRAVEDHLDFALGAQPRRPGAAKKGGGCRVARPVDLDFYSGREELWRVLR